MTFVDILIQELKDVKPFTKQRFQLHGNLKRKFNRTQTRNEKKILQQQNIFV